MLRENALRTARKLQHDLLRAWPKVRFADREKETTSKREASRRTSFPGGRAQKLDRRADCFTDALTKAAPLSTSLTSPKGPTVDIVAAGGLSKRTPILPQAPTWILRVVVLRALKGSAAACARLRRRPQKAVDHLGIQSNMRREVGKCWQVCMTDLSGASPRPSENLNGAEFSNSQHNSAFRSPGVALALRFEKPTATPPDKRCKTDAPTNARILPLRPRGRPASGMLRSGLRESTPPPTAGIPRLS